MLVGQKVLIKQTAQSAFAGKFGEVVRDCGPIDTVWLRVQGQDRSLLIWFPHDDLDEGC